MNRSFMQMLASQMAKGRYVCVGLDTDMLDLPVPVGADELPAKIPSCVHVHEDNGRLDVGTTMFGFNSDIVGATCDIAACYKLNSAFYEGLGPAGIQALRATISMIRTRAPGVPVILDAKRGDIGNTNRGYVKMGFEYLGADAITVAPYMGEQSLKLFLDRADKGIIILCKTSNPGAGEFQDLRVAPNPMELAYASQAKLPLDVNDRGLVPLYQYVALSVATSWNGNGNCALVVGATNDQHEIAAVRGIAPDCLLLIPGVGKQGGNLEAAVKAARENFIINSSRGIIFAGDGDDFDEKAREATRTLHTGIQNALKEKNG